MGKVRILIIASAIIAGVITAASFLVLKHELNGLTASGKIDKAELVYKRAEELIGADNSDKAVTALTMLITQYSESTYVGKSFEKLASIYLKKGDLAKARYYYNRFSKEFPDDASAAKTHTIIEKINIDAMQSPDILEDSIEYVVQPGDTLSGIAKKFNTTIELVKKINNLESDLIRLNQKLKIIVSKFSILVDKSQNILILKKDGEPFKTYTVSTGKDNSTPVGVFKIEEKLVKPLWYKIGAVVSPDSAEYELGQRWMGISIEGYGIHGTSDESNIGKQVTRGCIRMLNNDVIELFDIVPSGTEVVVVDGAK